jgi:hypothetical protein
MEQQNFVIIDREKYKTGDRVTATVVGVYINDAKIYIPTKEECDILYGGNYNRVLYICQNHVRDTDCYNKLGYKYSWSFDDIAAKEMKLKKIFLPFASEIISLSFPRNYNE